MDFKRLGLGLGVFSIALGVTELFAAKRIARALEAEGSEGLIKGFGARELLAGANLLAAPAVSTNVWNRVAGDAMDLTALGVAATNHPRNRTVWSAIAFVVGATVLDVVTAMGLDRESGKMLPVGR
jgi:hypothetical protein